MGEDTGERRALRRERDEAREQLEEERRRGDLARIDSLEQSRDRHEGRIDALELWRAEVDTERRAAARRAPRPEDQETALVRRDPELTPWQQVGANAGGGGLVAVILFVFGKLMGWW
jgi:hypothetical protein